MLSLSLENVSSEIKERAPLFHSVLSTFAINPHSRATYMKPHFGPIAMAAAILLKNRSRYMTAIQLLVTIFLYHSNWMVIGGGRGAINVPKLHKPPRPV